MSRYQKGTTNLDFTEARDSEKGTTNLDFTEARDSEWQWHQQGPIIIIIIINRFV